MLYRLGEYAGIVTSNIRSPFVFLHQNCKCEENELECSFHETENLIFETYKFNFDQILFSRTKKRLILIAIYFGF